MCKQLRILETELDGTLCRRYFCAIGEQAFYIREVKPFWVYMFSFGLSFTLVERQSQSKGKVLCIADVFSEDKFLCNVEQRSILLHRANYSGECVTVQSSNCLIPLKQMHGLLNSKVVGMSSVSLANRLVRELRNHRITCVRKSLLDSRDFDDVTDYVKKIKGFQDE